MSIAENKTIPTLTRLIDIRASELPDQVAFKFYDAKSGILQTLTYKELRDKALAVAGLLQKTIKPGDRVLLVYPPGFELIIAMFACMYVGGVCILTYPPLNDKFVQKIQHIIADAKPRLALCVKDFSVKFNQLKLAKSLFKIPLVHHLSKRMLHKVFELSNWDVDSLKWVVTDQLKKETVYNPIEIEPEQVVLFQYSSGSTSQPKGIMLTHQNLMHNLEAIHAGMCGSQSDLVACFWLPPYHDMGLIGGIFSPIFARSPSILFSPMDFLRRPLSWLEMITKHKVTITGGPNFAYEYCVNRITPEQKKSLDLSSWKIAFCGAEPIHADTIEKFYEYFKECGLSHEAFCPCYGLAESTVFVSAVGPSQNYLSGSFSNTSLKKREVDHIALNDKDAKLLVGVGRPSFNVKIADPDNFQLLAENKVGEIWIEHNKSIAQGYWNQPELTKEVFQAKLADDHSNASYLRTGDLGFIHQNQLFICGRIKDLIIIHGANFYPQDLELTVSYAHSAVRAGCVAAFSMEVEYEEKLAIVCEVNEFHDYDSVIHSITQSIARDHQLAVHTIALIKPRELPKTTSGKIQRRLCRELLCKRDLPIVKLWFVDQITNDKHIVPGSDEMQLVQANELRAWLINKIAVRSQIKPESVDCNQAFTEFGIDSLELVGIVDELEKFLNKKIDLGLFWDFPTINMIADYFATAPGSISVQKINNQFSNGVGEKGVFKKAGKTGILIIHGFSGTPGEVLEFGNQLWKENITIAIPQLAGHCSSEKDLKLSNRHDWYESVEKAYNLLAEHCDQIYVAGLSVGGLLALKLAAEKKEKLVGVILLSLVFFYDGWNMSKLKINLLMPFIIHTPLRFLTAFKERSPYGIKDERVRQSIELIMKNQRSNASEQIGIMKISGSSLKEVNNLIRDTKRLLPHIHCPALIIHSLEDDMASIKNVEFLQRKIGTKQIKLCYLNDCYHVITLDKKKNEVAAHVLHFLVANK
ncbi:alpha/beta fold hydrolase [Legionella fallonii]|uniref:Putative Acylglycerol lipase n=1 Tax=Legionella fallonii LLAP-10 TaxID=1212491 RepID=A0A098G1E8_9GAMM|nr:alpha/beta fold hydrolase [Legionella fallonii]CEG55811.1 putative Acylglycerol lipase [Legionella fallonii LLAP-10]